MNLLITLIYSIFILIGILLGKIIKSKKDISLISISISLGSILTLIIYDLINNGYNTFKNPDKIKMIVIILVFIMLGMCFIKLFDKLLNESNKNKDLINLGLITIISFLLYNATNGIMFYNMSLNKNIVILLLIEGTYNIIIGLLVSILLNKETKKKKIIYFLILILSTMFGYLLSMLIVNALSRVIISSLNLISLGMLSYILIFKFIPYVYKSKKIKSIIYIIFGIAIILINNLI